MAWPWSQQGQGRRGLCRRPAQMPLSSRPQLCPPQAGRASAEDPGGRGAAEAVPHAEVPPGLPEGPQRCHRHPGLHAGHVCAESLPPGV